LRQLAEAERSPVAAVKVEHAPARCDVRRQLPCDCAAVEEREILNSFANGWSLIRAHDPRQGMGVPTRSVETRLAHRLIVPLLPRFELSVCAGFEMLGVGDEGQMAMEIGDRLLHSHLRHLLRMHPSSRLLNEVDEVDKALRERLLSFRKL